MYFEFEKNITGGHGFGLPAMHVADQCSCLVLVIGTFIGSFLNCKYGVPGCRYKLPSLLDGNVCEHTRVVDLAVLERITINLHAVLRPVIVCNGPGCVSSILTTPAVSNRTAYSGSSGTESGLKCVDVISERVCVNQLDQC